MSRYTAWHVKKQLDINVCKGQIDKRIANVLCHNYFDELNEIKKNKILCQFTRNYCHCQECMIIERRVPTRFDASKPAEDN